MATTQHDPDDSLAGHDTAASDTAGNSTAGSSAPSRDVPASSRLHPMQWLRALGVAALAAAIVSLVLLAFSWPTVTAEAKNLPIAVVGSQKQVDNLVDNAPDDLLDVHKVSSRSKAVKQIKHRDVYGAVILNGKNPEILTASAGSPAVAQQLRGIGTQMQLKIDAKAMKGMEDALGKMQKAMQNPQAAQGAGQQDGQQSAGQQGASGADKAGKGSTQKQKVPNVKVTDVVPLNDNDPQGAGLAIAGLPLTIGGIVGGTLISTMVRSRRLRVLAVIGYGIVGGLALAGILQGWFGILQGTYGMNALAAGLAIASTAALINGFVSLIGPAGIGIGALLTMFIGNPLSSLSQPKEFLPWHWGEIGQFFVPGAAGTLLRDLSYFPKAPMSQDWWVLIAWTLAGILLILVGHIVARSKERRAAHPARH